MILSRYDPNWPVEFETEREELMTILGEKAGRIEHVGSTSVPGLQAKSVIDIQVSVPEINIAIYKEKLKKLGYKHLPTDPPLGDVYPFFHKPARWPTTHHIHLCKAGGGEEKAHLAFRDWLRSHPADRDHYGALKEELAKDVNERDVKTLFEYTERKGSWIQEITQKAVEAGLGE